MFIENSHINSIKRRFIALVTDYGYKDPYVGVVKSVIKTINPYVEIIDLTHDVNRHDVLEAAIILLVSAKYFPRKTIFMCIVDPDVGSERKALLIQTRNYYLIGPDNGCLTLLAQQDGIVKIFDISSSKYALAERSHTFHGRDVFAPVSAYLSLGIEPELLGIPISINEIKLLDFKKPIVRNNIIEAEAIYIDVFGNIMTNISSELVSELNINTGDLLKININNKIFNCKFVKYFSQVNPGQYACYINSWNYFEIAINRGNAARELGVNRGDKVLVEFK
ncbi:MAG: S-adenosyl-l-methionine hydroxide adenosyltransferase family protein [Desulfurococcaceae archaeon]